MDIEGMQNRMQELTEGFGKKSEASFEERVVKQLLKFVRQDETVSPPDRKSGYTMAWFRKNYQFPVHLKVEKIPWLHETDWGDLFTRFSKTKIAEKFDEWYEECRDNGTARPICGVAAQWPHRGLLVMHNFNHPPRVGYTQIVRPMKFGTIIFEELEALGEAVRGD